MIMIDADPKCTLIPDSVSYSGPAELTKHIVKEVTICQTNKMTRSGVIVEVVLVRPLLGTILTVFSVHTHQYSTCPESDSQGLWSGSHGDGH